MTQMNYLATVDRQVADTKARMKAVRDQSVERLIEIMQEPGPSKATTGKAIAIGAGLGKVKKNGERGVSKRAYGPIRNPGGSGNIPVDTGFLWSSLKAAVGAANFALVRNPDPNGSYTFDMGQIALVIANAEITDAIEAVYTAAYARVAEYGGPNRQARRFVGLAAQQWQRVVDETAAELRMRKGG